MKRIWVIARKELSAYFGSPVALIFLGLFLIFTLVAFFWVGGFYTRNIADVRPLFRSMPLLLLFLVAALTMRGWSEEQRSGTLEILLTLPVRRVELVLGKFLAVMILVAMALALTLFLPITVSILSSTGLDWGPVVGGYLAALLLASAYVAIGLFVSSLTDNQIVSLIVTVVVAGLLYVAGTTMVSGLAGEVLGTVLKAIGTGSRFESIERGVVDLRDLLYYLSLTVLFLVLNIVTLDAKRWSKGSQTARYRGQVWLTVVLVLGNLLLLNAWLFPLGALRADLTADQKYSLSPVTKDLVSHLQEPLLIRAYISERTHPLLAPLVPEIRDMLREYEIASDGRIQVEVLDPRDDEEMEAEANQIYGIRPTPFRIADVYETSVINSYFDILVRYGDQHVVLGFGDLIEVESSPTGEPDVRLRNLEYDLTRAVKKVVYGFQSIDSVLASFEEPIRLTALVTPNTLPAGLQGVPALIDKVAAELVEKSGGKLSYESIDPDAAGSPVTRQSLINSMGIYPISASLFSSDSYYLHLILQTGDQAQLLYPSGDLTEADLRLELEAALKRAAPGFLKTVGLWQPSLAPTQDMYGNMVQPISSWNAVQDQLQQDYTVKQVDLSTGRVPGDVDALVVISPRDMSDLERFAVDQYLMRGGAVVVLGGSFALPAQQFPGGLYVEQVSGGLEDLLADYGVDIDGTMVLDPRNEPLPVQVQRSVGGMQVIEIQELGYPYFVDIRPDSMSQESAIVSGLPAVTLHWVSPLTVDETKNAERDVTVLLQSTDEAWLSSEIDVQPNMEEHPEYGFAVEGAQEARALAVSIRGSFDSYYTEHATPFESGEVPSDTVTTPLGTVEVSPESARLVVVGSSEFIDDAVLELSASLSADRYLNNLQLVQNAVDWSLEDEDLLTIRSRGTYARLLKPLDNAQKAGWMWANYAIALLALAAIGIVWVVRRRGERPMELVPGPELDDGTEQIEEGGSDE